MLVLRAAAKLNQVTSVRSGKINQIENRLTNIFEETKDYKRGAEFNAYH
jgi:hypothetical protein